MFQQQLESRATVGSALAIPNLRRFTMFDSFATIVLWLFVINLGIAFGAGLYEARIVVPQWLSPSPESGLSWNAELARQSNTGMRFWVYVTTVPLTLLT